MQSKLSTKTHTNKWVSAALEIFTNPTCRWVTIAAAFRFFGGYSIGFFIQLYFLGIYESYKDTYSYLNAILISSCGLISTVAGGVISDKYEKRGNYKMKSYVCMFAGIMGIPTIMAVTLC